MKKDAIMIHEKDNVATVLRDIEPDETVTIGLGEEGIEMPIHEHIPYGHKFAVRDIQKGGNIFKYGEVIGRATKDIPAGTHAHIQNIESLRGRGDLER
jgi:altronate dehydratase small subunit